MILAKQFWVETTILTQIEMRIKKITIEKKRLWKKNIDDSNQHKFRPKLILELRVGKGRLVTVLKHWFKSALGITWEFNRDK